LYLSEHGKTLFFECEKKRKAFALAALLSRNEKTVFLRSTTASLPGCVEWMFCECGTDCIDAQ
jgi:hypothetical protein